MLIINKIKQVLDKLKKDFNAHLAETAQDNDVHGLKTLFQNQQFVNLLKNGDFASWSQGDNAAPDGWNKQAEVSVSKTAGRVTGKNALAITGTSVDWKKVYQIIGYIFQDKITVSFWARRTSGTSGSSVVVRDATIDGTSLGSVVINSDVWTLYSFTATGCSNKNLYLTIDARVDSAFEVSEFLVTPGELPVAFANNPLDKALKAVDYQNTAGTNYEYGLLKMQCGEGKWATNGAGTGLFTTTITFPKTFTKFLGAMAFIGLTAYPDRFGAVTVANPDISTMDVVVEVKVSLDYDQHFFWIAWGVE